MSWFNWWKKTATQSPGEAKQALTVDPLANYQPHRFFASEVVINDLPLFTAFQGRLMLRSDPVVSFAMNVRNACLMGADVEVTGDNERVVTWVKEQWETLWNQHRTKLTSAKRFGFAALQLTWKIKDGMLAIDSVKDFAPEDVRARTHEGKVIGFRVRGGGEKEVILKQPRAMWMSHNAEYGSPYGNGILRRQYPPWFEKWMPGGAKKLTQMRMLKDAFVGDVIWYPPNLTVDLPDGQGGTRRIPWKDLLREMAENRKSGGVMSLPSFYDDKGNKLVDYKEPQSIPGGTDLFEWNDKLDQAIFMGADVPLEIVQAAETGSGFSGRSIPLMVVLSVCTEELTEIVKSVTEPLRLVAALNFGGEPDFEIKPKSLVESMAKDSSGSPMGGASMGGQPGQKPMPGQQQPPAQNGSRMGWVDNDGNVTQFDEADARWITIGGRQEGDKEHAGGFPVQIDGQGNIVKSGGHQGLVGQHVNRIGEFFRGQRSQAAHEQEMKDWGSRKGWGTIVARQSARWRIKPEQYEEVAGQVWNDKQTRHAEREAAKRYARKRLNLNAGDVERLENKGLDSGSQHERIKGLDTIGREMASLFPALGWGEGYGSGDESKVDYGERLWELVREGKLELPAKTSREFHAAVDEHLGQQWDKKKKAKSESKQQPKEADDSFEFGANQFDEGPADTTTDDELHTPPLLASRRRILTAAERIRALKKNDLTLADLAQAIEAELRALQPGIQADLSASIYGGALTGMADAIASVPATLSPPPEFALGMPPAPPAVPPPAAALFPDDEPPGVRFPALEDALEVLEASPVSATLDYRQTAALAREGAFAVTGDLTDQAVADVRDILARTIREGGNEADFVDTIVTRLGDEGGPLSEAHLAQVFRTNTATAVSNGQHRALQAPMVSDSFPYRSFFATSDQRVRPEHIALEKLGLDGTNIYRQEDPTWLKFRPPFDFGCRCSWSPTTVLQAARRGVTEAKEWWERAKAMAAEQGGTPDEYLGRTAPAEPARVSPPPFNPSPEFERR